MIFGVAYGGGMPLYASLARDYFGQHIMGTVFGAATMLSSLGMSIGPVAGGWVFDTFSNYAWLYIASAAVAVGAVLLAMTFPETSTSPHGGMTYGSEGIAGWGIRKLLWPLLLSVNPW